jgi:hypothetical protein
VFSSIRRILKDGKKKKELISIIIFLSREEEKSMRLKFYCNLKTTCTTIFPLVLGLMGYMKGYK